MKFPAAFLNGILTICLFPIGILAEEKGCNENLTSFVIQANRKIEGNEPILKKTVDSLTQCSKFCLNLPSCSTFNFHSSMSNSSHFECHLFSTLPADANSIKSTKTTLGRKVCLQKKCERRSFAFEKFENRALSNSTHILRTYSVLVDECLAECQKEPLCRAAFHNRDTSLCQLSKVSINSVYNPRLFMRGSKNIDVYENNCIEYPMTTAGCSFMRVNGGGLKQVSDQILQRIEDVEECEQLCLVRARVSDPCRSYTFDNETSECHLMWASSRMIGRSPLENMLSNLAHGDLDDCMNFSLKCRESSIEIKASSMRMFSGKVMTKKQKKTICEDKFSGDFEFSSKFEFEKCGMESKKSIDSIYRGMVFVKEGSTNLVTIRDKMLQIKCRMHKPVLTEEQSISVKLNVKENRNQTIKMMMDDNFPTPSSTLSTPTPKPSFSLKILSSNSTEADKVQIGDFGWIVLLVKNNADDFSITNLVARDVHSGQIIRIIDEEGCVTRRDIVKHIEKTRESIKLRINFSGFQKQTEVVYHTMIETCTVGCMPKCNEDLLEDTPESLSSGPLSLDLPRHRMVKRSVVGEPRELELINDVYEIRGHRLTLLTPVEKSSTASTSSSILEVLKTKKVSNTSPEEVYDGDIVIKKKTANLSSTIHHCFIDDITCLFTIVLASVQLFLLVACVLVMYCYYQEWRHFRQNQTPIDRNNIQHYHFGANQNSSAKDTDIPPASQVQ